MGTAFSLWVITVENLVLVVLIGAAALAVGVMLGFFWAGRLQARDESRVAEAEAKLDTFRTDVNEHFLKTATMFQSLGEQYRELYRHMADGAEKLCDAELVGQKPGFILPAEIEVVAESAVISDPEPAAVEPEETVVAEASPEAIADEQPPADYVVDGEAEAAQPAEPVSAEPVAEDASAVEAAEQAVESEDTEAAPVEDESPVVAKDTPAENDEEAPRTYH